MIIGCDFDGTLCIHDFPRIGAPLMSHINRLKVAQKNGDRIILWTCREGKYLKEAVEWCKGHGIIFDAVNENLEEFRGQEMASRKIYADAYIDDRNMKFKRL